jgi:hypothetical protein
MKIQLSFVLAGLLVAAEAPAQSNQGNQQQNGPGTCTNPGNGPGTGQQGPGNGTGTGTGSRNGNTQGPGTGGNGNGGVCPNPSTDGPNGTGSGNGPGNGTGTGTGSRNGNTQGPGTGGNGNGGVCPNPSTDGPSGQGGNNALITAYIESLPVQVVDAGERMFLEYMREEEKLARDIYQALYQTWQVPAFQSIANAEQTHVDLVQYAMQRYGIPDPLQSNAPGVYTIPALTQLYQVAVTFGQQSLAMAFFVGAVVEDCDMLDLHSALAGTDNRDLDTVWQNLDRGSRNHMRSFYGQLENQGSTYFGLFLGPTAIQAIVTTPYESGAVDENGNLL